MKGEKGTEKDREGDFTCIPEATVEMEIYLVLVYVLSLTSKGCHGNQASKCRVSPWYRHTILQQLGCLAFYLDSSSSHV